MNRAFTLVELLIVVAVLGILAAIAMPQFESYAQEAKETAAKDNLRILRSTIERYAAQHGGAPPGYPGDDTSRAPSANFFRIQLCRDSAYLRKIPENPFNNLNSVRIVGAIAAEMAADTGWVYKPSTKTIVLNTAGSDSQGVRYSEY